MYDFNGAKEFYMIFLYATIQLNLGFFLSVISCVICVIVQKRENLHEDLGFTVLCILILRMYTLLDILYHSEV